ncbi:MAG: RNA polymerase sigma factor [Idiomarina sp.]|nr:RNA polymerase sigma factor [Idiomarina sp.]
MQTTENPYLQWYPGALALARNLLGCHASAEDVLQTSISKTLGSSALPIDEAAQRVWFFKVVRNGCFDYLRDQKRFNADADIEEAVGFSDTPDLVDASQRQQWVRAALLTLSSEQREIIVLRDVNDLSYADIAHILQLNSGTVMSRLHRARMALRQALLMLEKSHPVSTQATSATSSPGGTHE